MQKSQKLQEQIEAAIRHAKRIERSASEGLAELDQKVARFALGALTADLKEKYAATPQVLAYLDQVQEDILQRLELFKGETEGEPSTPAAAPKTSRIPSGDTR